MASNTCELIYLSTGIHRREWGEPIPKAWMITMTVFCVINVLLDLSYLCTAAFVYQLLLKSAETSSAATVFLGVWCAALVDWVLEVLVSICIAMVWRDKVSHFVRLVVTNICFTAMQYGSLPLTAYGYLSAIPNTNYTTVLQENPGVRCFMYFAFIQGTSYGLATFLMVAWTKEQYIRGGALFQSILGIIYSCMMGAYNKKSQIKENTAIIVVRSCIYFFLMAVIFTNGVAMVVNFLKDAPELERSTGLALFGFLTIAAVPFLVVCALVLIAIWYCLCKKPKVEPKTTTAELLMTGALIAAGAGDG